MRKLAFTLVELLVVVAIVAVLVALVAPLVTRAVKNARNLQCMSNMKQLGVAMQNYVNVHAKLPSAVWDDRYTSWLNGPPPTPRPGNDFSIEDVKGGSIYQFSNDVKVYKCPLDEGADAPGGGIVDSVFSYTMNNVFSRRAPYANGFESRVILLVEESPKTIQKPANGGEKRYGAFEDTDRVELTRDMRGKELLSHVLFLDMHTDRQKFSAETRASDPIFSDYPEGTPTPSP